MKYWQSLKSLLALLILIILILSCVKDKGEVVRGYVETDAKLQINNYCGIDELQILVIIESGKSVWFRVPEEYWQGSDLLSQRPTGRRIYIEGRYYEKALLGSCDGIYEISFAYLKE